jgi:hypothetical protein
MTRELHYLELLKLAESLCSREITSVDVTSALLEKTAARSPALQLRLDHGSLNKTKRRNTSSVRGIADSLKSPLRALSPGRGLSRTFIADRF